MQHNILAKFLEATLLLTMQQKVVMALDGILGILQKIAIRN